MSIIQSLLSKLSFRKENKEPAWQTRISQNCGVVFHIPPTPGGVWAYAEGPTDSTSLGGKWGFDSWDAHVFFIMELNKDSHAARSDIPAIAVATSTKTYKNKDELFAFLSKKAEENNTLKDFISEKLKYSVLRRGDMKIWGKEIMVISFSGFGYAIEQLYYVFSTDKHSYMISKNPGKDSDDLVKQDIEKIFLRLEFLDK